MSTASVVTGAQIHPRGQLMKLGRYQTPDGERWLVGRRVGGAVCVVDTPAPGVRGKRYLVENDLHKRDELIELLRDYLTRSRALGAPAAAADLLADSIDTVLRA